MRVAIYARVSTEAQEARGTIGSQVAALRERVAAEGHEVVSEFLDDGHSGARLDRPGSTPCATRRRRGSSTRCGACRRTGWPASTPTRSSCSKNSPGWVWPCSSPTPPASMTTPKPVCSPRFRA